ncbi:MAG: hypothetical protein WAW41_12075 [Methylobacter sp.]
MRENDKEVDVDFNEALRRIAHTPKSVIDKDKQEKESAPPIESGTGKVEKQSPPVTSYKQ